MGATTCFAFLLGLLDFVVTCGDRNNSDNSPRLFNANKNQFLLILVASLSLGGLFGAVFAAMDLEDEHYLSQLRSKLALEENLCNPIGAVVGGIVGLLYNRLEDNTVASYSELSVMESSDSDLDEHEKLTHTA